MAKGVRLVFHSVSCLCRDCRWEDVWFDSTGPRWLLFRDMDGLREEDAVFGRLTAEPVPEAV